MANSDEKWYFSKERLESSPSRQCGIDEGKELSYRQQAANFIQDMGQRLKVSQLCINTAIVYMHRFYVFHSFTHFHWASIASASIFLAAKVEEQPRKLEHVIKYANLCKNPHDTRFEMTSERYQAQSQDLVFNENILLQTLGFDVAIDHPHTHVVRCCHLVRASKDLAQTSYFMASNSLHLTTMCLQYKPTVVACFCIHLVCKWSNWEIPLSNERREWFSYVDPTVTSELLKNLTEEFLTIFEKCPSRLKEKIMSIGGYFEGERKLGMLTDSKDPHHRPNYDAMKPGLGDDPHKHRPKPHEAGSSGQHSQDREYRDKREAERMARHAAAKQPLSGSCLSKPIVPSGHHRPPVDPNKIKHNRPTSSSHSFSGSNSSSSSSSGSSRPDPHRDILREATRDIGLKDYHSREIEGIKAQGVNIGSNREVRNEKELQKRDSMAKPNVGEINAYLDRSSYAPLEKRTDMTKPRPPSEANKVPHRHDESKMYLKNENEIKKHLNSSGVYDKSPYLNKSSTIQRKLDNTFDPTKSVQKQQIKMELPNGQNNMNSIFSVPQLIDDTKIKTEVKDELIPPMIKRPSLFSPEKSPPLVKKEKPSPNPVKLPLDIPQLLANPLGPPLSPFNSPEGEKRVRTTSSSSEPELRPVMQKIEQVEGFENILRDSGIKVPKHQVPDIITPITDIKTAPQPKELSKELKPPDLIPPFTNTTPTPLSQPLVNGIETNPTLISNLLKETTAVLHLPTIASPTEKPETKDSKDHYHKERKKKNKEKHKHKDKDKSKEEKEKKKKHKDKDREKHKNKEKIKEKVEEPAQPIKITIPKDKIQPPDAAGSGLKIKIPKDRIKADTILEQPHVGGLKIKIPKDVINNFTGESKKRDRERTSPSDAPPTKLSKSSYNRTNDSKMNGRNSFGKVSNNSDKNRPSQQQPPQPPAQQHFNNVQNNSMSCMQQQSIQQPHYLMYAPTNIPPPFNMNVPPPFMYHQNAQLYYNYPPMYPSQTMYPPPPMPSNGSGAPPLPNDAPPDNPPPPPPE